MIEYLKTMFDISSWEISKVDIGVMIGYMVLMMVVGWICKGLSKDISDYVRMGCKSTWWLMGTSIFMLMTSAGTLTGGPAQAYMSGWSFLIMGLGGFIGWLCMAAFFAPWMRRTRAITPADAIRLRYGVLVEQVNAYIGAVGGMLWGGVWLYSFALFMAVIFHVPIPTVVIFVGIIVVFYSVSGGSWSVQITDTLQAYILVPIVLVVFFLSLKEVGWIGGLFEGIKAKNLSEDYKIIMDVGHVYSSKAGRVGAGYFSIGWLIASIVYAFALSANVTSCWRFLSCKSDSDARKAALLAGCLLFFGAAVWYVPGMVARIKYEDQVNALIKPKAEETSVEKGEADKKTDSGETSAEGTAAAKPPAAEGTTIAAGDSQTTDDQQQTPREADKQTAPPEGSEEADEEEEKLYLPSAADGAYAIVAKNVLPPGLLGLVVIALLAATMSSLDSSLTGNAGIVCNNIYPALVRLFGGQPWTGKKLLRLTQATNFLLGLWAIILALLIWKGAQDTSIYEISLEIILLVSLPMVLSMVLSFFVPWLPWWAPLVGMFFGFGGSLTFRFSGDLAGWAADVSWISGGVASSLQNFADWIGALMWHHKIYINMGLTMLPTLATSIFWSTASAKYRAKVDNFFQQIRTPVDFEKEVGGAMDHTLMKIIGGMGLAVAAVILVLIFFAKDENGDFNMTSVWSILFVVAFIATISTIMLVIGVVKDRKKKQEELGVDGPEGGEG